MKHVIAIVFGLFLSFTAIAPVLATPSVACPACQIILEGDNGGSKDFSDRIVEEPNTNVFVLDHPSNLTIFSDIDFHYEVVFDPTHASAQFAFSFTNPEDFPLFFHMVMITPVNLNGTIQASSALSFSLTDTGNSGVAAFFAEGHTDHPAVFSDFSSTGPSTPSLGVDVGPSFAAAAPSAQPFCTTFIGNTGNCGPFTATNTFTTFGPVDRMVADLFFSISAHDSVFISGEVFQTQIAGPAVPEPATVLLLGTGLLGLVGWRRNSSRG